MSRPLRQVRDRSPRGSDDFYGPVDWNEGLTTYREGRVIESNPDRLESYPAFQKRIAEKGKQVKPKKKVNPVLSEQERKESTNLTPPPKKMGSHDKNLNNKFV